MDIEFMHRRMQMHHRMLHMLTEDFDDDMLFSLHPGKGNRPFGDLPGGIGGLRVEDRHNLRLYLADDRKSGWMNRVRLTKETFFLLAAEISRHPPFVDSPSLDVDEHLFTTLYYLAHGPAYAELCGELGLGAGTIRDYVCRTVEAICWMQDDWIHFPETAEEMDATEQEFFAIHKLPGCIGIVDGTDIPIHKPKLADAPASWEGFKGVCQNAQIICDAKGYVTFVKAGLPGRMHDSPALQGTHIYDMRHDMVARGKYLIADAGYALCPWLLTAFRETIAATDRRKLYYNRFLCGRRALIERVIGKIKGRFRILVGVCRIKTMLRLSAIVTACCVLHNFCLRHNDLLPDELVVEDDQDDEDLLARVPVHAGDGDDPVLARNTQDAFIDLFNTDLYKNYSMTLRGIGMSLI